jgi:hypothetical protein
MGPSQFADWPGLVEVVNDPSRTSFMWGNLGAFSASFHGDVNALGRALRAFRRLRDRGAGGDHAPGS